MVPECPLGTLPSGWMLTTLGDVCHRNGGSIQTGPFGSQLHASDYVAHGVPSIMPQNIGDNRVLPDGIARISEEDAHRLARYRVRAGDIVYSRRGDLERRALIRETENEWLCGTGCLRVRVGKGEVDPEYTSYYLAHPVVRAWIVRHAVGATMLNLNTSILGALPFAFPPVLNQVVIARILGTLDDKIELNRRMNETLEEIARTLFRSWFVDFDPVRAKAEGQEPFGMDEMTAGLFPDSLQESVVGELPRGWAATSLDKVAHFLNGLPLQKYPPRGDGLDLPIIKIAQLRSRSTASCDMANGDVPELYRIQNGDILFSWSGTLEVDLWCSGDGALNQHLFKVTSADYPNWLILQWLCYHLPTFRRIASSKATTMGHIQRHHIAEAVVAIPPPRLLSRLSTTFQPLLDLVVENRLQNLTLAGLRDALLPKLLSGEIRVREAERVVEAVA